MAKLETLELVYQPYNSAGRLPTSKGLRAFVNYLMQSSPDHFLQQNNISL
jgi:transcriptional regulator of heat shock response